MYCKTISYLVIDTTLASGNTLSSGKTDNVT